MSKAYNFCNNCGKTGHAFHQCKHPITSIGIIAVRCKDNILEFKMNPFFNRLYFINCSSDVNFEKI